jgi:hypothetical protein
MIPKGFKGSRIQGAKRNTKKLSIIKGLGVYTVFKEA